MIRFLNIKRVAAYCTIGILAVAIALPLLAAWAINTTYVKEQLSDYLYQKSGVRIYSDTFSIAVFPLPALRLADLSLHLDDQTDIKIHQLQFNLNFRQLLQGKLGLGKIVVQSPQITVKDSGHRSVRSRPVFPLPFDTKALKEHLTFLPDDQAAITIDIHNAVSDYFGRMDGSVSYDIQQNKLKIDTIVNGLHFSPSQIAGPQFNRYLDLKRITIDQLVLSATLTPDNTVTGNSRASGLAFTSGTQKILLDANTVDLSFILSEHVQQVHVQPVLLTYPSATVGVEFFHHPEEKKAEIRFSGNAVHVDQAREMSRILFKEMIVPQTIFDILLDGIVPRVTVAFESSNLETLFNEHHLTLEGKISSGKVHIPQTQLIADQIEGDVLIQDGILDIDTAAGSIQTSKIRKGQLSIDLLNHDNVPFTGRFLIDLDLAMLPQTLISLLPETLLAQEMARVQQISGHALSTELRLELAPNTRMPSVYVKTKPFKAMGRYDRVPEEIRVDQIQVVYTPDHLQVNKFSGRINGCDITDLFAAVDFTNDPWIELKSGSAILDLTSAIPWLSTYPAPQQMIAPVTSGSGSVYVDTITASGPVFKPSQWKYQLTGKTEAVTLFDKPSHPQIENLSCRYLLSDTTVKLENLQARIHQTQIFGGFSDNIYFTSLQTPFELHTAVFQTGKTLGLIFRGTVAFSTGPRLFIEMSGSRLSSVNINLLHLEDPGVSDAQLTIEKDRQTLLFDFKGRLETPSLDRLLKPGSFLEKQLHRLTENQPVVIHTDADNLLNIHVQTLDLNALTASTELSLTPHLLTKNLINFNAQKIKFKTLCFTDVSTSISFKKDHSYIRLKSADLCGINYRGYINIKDGKVYVDLPFAAEDSDNIQPLLSCLLKKENFMDGAYSLSGDLLAKGVPTEDINRGVEGSLVFDARQGRIYTLTLLSRILSVLNVSNVFKGAVPDVTQKGFAYKKITIKADIKDSVIHLTHAIIDGQDMAMIFSGQIDPINDRIDLTCLVAPFKTVDLIIEKIPIISTLLGGRLVSVPVRASGKLSDPSVFPLHPSAVGKGLIDMMSTILKTPITLWEKMAGEQ